MNILVISSILPIPGIRHANDFIFQTYSHYRDLYPKDKIIIINPVKIDFNLFRILRGKTRLQILKRKLNWTIRDFEVHIFPFLSTKRFNNLHSVITGSIYNINRKRINMLFSEHNFDLVHARYVFSDGLLAYMLSKKFNIPYFINTHNEKVYFEHSGSRRRAVRILNNAAFVLPLNHSNYLYFKTLSIKNMERTTHGFNKDFVRKQKPESKKKISILTVSVLIKLKNIDKVIHAISKLMPAYDLTYTIIGKGSEKEHLVNLVESLNLTDHVSFIDQIPHSEISDEMYKHDIFIMPSYFETFGRVYFEAMAMGIPIICAKNSGIFGLFKDKEEGIAVNHLDINEISDALEFLITNPTDRLRIGENGQKLVVNYTWENIAKDLHTKYLNSLTK